MHKPTMTLSEELKWRGFYNQTTFASPGDLDKKRMAFYWGVDPSAPSMTVGNLAAAMMVRVFMKHGWEPYLLIGGATGLIGDPDGKAQERDLKTPQEIARNKAALTAQYKQIFRGEAFKIVDNFDWFRNMGYLEFLRNVGKHVPLRQMVSRDFVQSRISEDGAGISYAEFSYSLIQAYDFLHLFEKHGVTLQLSGSDQWGNSIAGVDLIRRKTGKEAHIWTAPLLINKTTGVKFGKSEGGAVWLDAELTSPYAFYQFWLNTDDDSVGDYLKIFTDLDKEEIANLMKQFEANRGERLAQKRLAHEVTEIVHGKEQVAIVEKITNVLFGDDKFMELPESAKTMLAKELVSVDASDNLAHTLVRAGLASSNTEATRFLASGAIYINNEKWQEDSFTGFVKGKNLIRRGKNKFAIVVE